jgi:hypothetical protein
VGSESGHYGACQQCLTDCPVPAVPYILSQIRSSLKLPHSQKAVHLAAGIGALGADLYVLGCKM